MNARRSDDLELLVQGWLAAQGSTNTRTAYGHDAAHFRQWCAAQDRQPLRITTADLASYLAHCRGEGSAPSTVARRRAALASFYRYAVATDAIGANPVGPPSSTARAASATAVLDDEQTRSLLSAADRQGSKSAALVRLLLCDGLRLGEILDANAEDVQGTPTRAGLTVVRGGFPADIRLRRATGRRLFEYRSERRRGPLFLGDTPHRRSTRLTRFGADYLVKRVATAAAIEGPVSANTLRRRFVIDAHENGRSMTDIRNHVGHQDVRTTRRYLNPEPSKR
jgi:integrase/recombinase XerD